MEKIKIYNSKYILRKAWLSYIVFAALAFLQCYKHWFDWSWFILSAIYVAAWAVVIIRFANFKSKVILEITDEGINDHNKKRFIKWSDVYNLTLVAGAVAVILHHPETAYPKSIWSKLVYRSNNWLYGSPVLINTDVLKGKELDNYNLIYDYMEAVERKAGVVPPR